MLGRFRQRSASKFGNCPTTLLVPGHGQMSFHSGKEARRAAELGALEKAKLISDLKFQPQFNLVVNGIHICKYIADFEYYDQNGRTVEDVKGCRTEVYKFKKRLMLACHKIEVLET